ncbi:carboxylic ester hydrolase [Aureococcus anophagefferens]|nr:carboxylic ester hydrolase [Aureococcus anophagefferens]
MARRYRVKGKGLLLRAAAAMDSKKIIQYPTDTIVTVAKEATVGETDRAYVVAASMPEGGAAERFDEGVSAVVGWGSMRVLELLDETELLELEKTRRCRRRCRRTGRRRGPSARGATAWASASTATARRARCSRRGTDHGAGVAAGRARGRFTGLLDADNFKYAPPPPEATIFTADAVKDGAKLTVYAPPHDERSLPAVVFAHGGGFMSGSRRHVDGLCRELAVRAAVAVVSVEYRLAPEHPFPAGLDDVRSAVSYCRGSPALPNAGAIDGARVALAGESAGRTWPTSPRCSRDDDDDERRRGRDAAERAPEEAVAPLRAALHAPARAALRRAQRRRVRPRPLFGASSWTTCEVAYRERRDDWRVAPLDAVAAKTLDLDGFATPTLILAAELDPLADQAFLYHDALLAAGAPSGASRAAPSTRSSTTPPPRRGATRASTRPPPTSGRTSTGVS